MDKIFKVYDSFEVKESKDDRTLEFVGSKEITDRDKEIVKVKGLDLKNYKTNPVVLWSHQYSQPPVAKATKVWKSKDELKFKIKFAEPEEYSFADTIYKLYKNGYMNAVSIGFIPDYDSIEFPSEGKNINRIYHKAELIELSLVPVGANPAALLTSKGIVKAMEDEVIDKLELDEIKYYIEELFETEEKEVIPPCNDCLIDGCESDCACECHDDGAEKMVLVDEKEITTEEEAELLRIQLGYSKLLCSECGKSWDEEKEEREQKELNIDDGNNYIDELLSVFRSEKEQKENLEEEEIDELIQILKKEIKQNG